MDEASSESSAYGELGCLHSLLGNFEQAISCLQHQLRLAREAGDRLSEGEAACGLGGVYQQMGEYDKALDFHQLDLQLAKEVDSSACQCKWYLTML
jgi:tetratricopeptide (TPR) repeat protein